MLNNVPVRTLNRLRIKPFKQFVGEDDKTETAPTLRSSPRKELSTLSIEASFSGTQRIPRLRARATTARTKELEKAVRRRI